MSQVKGIPYGISDFNRMRNENFYFVDKTMYLPLIEEMPSYLFLIRPRRFGKSLFLSMMRTYYDIIQKDNFDKYFGDLWIGSRPTKQHNSFQVLFFDFSKAGCSLPGADLMSSFNEYCSIIINQFAHAYASYYDEDFKSTVESIESAKAKLSYIEVKAKEKGYPLYLIIDEYDNFTNVILSEHGQKMFHDLTHASGFYREYFKQFKGMFDRIFLMGVSPITLDDLSSGYNIDWNISTDSRFNAMIGFDETEVREMLRYYQQNGKLVGDVEAMITEMKPWYDNYCFAKESLERDPKMFNCDMVLYYLRHYITLGKSPEQMIDPNTRTDYNKMKKLICGMTMCITVCSQMIFPQTAFAATKAAVEKAGEAFVAGMTETAEAEEVLSEEELRQQIVDFALQFEGNPYVYGGTSLTNGADCSGFVMSVFAQFGYSLPRVAADQYNQSAKKSVEDLEPGDLIFYGSGISHVALYIGNGQIIHASTSASGIKISNYDYEAPVGVGTYIEADGFFSE